MNYAALILVPQSLFQEIGVAPLLHNSDTALKRMLKTAFTTEGRRLPGTSNPRLSLRADFPGGDLILL